MVVKRKVRKGAARTAKQKAALRKAQLASARKRRGRGKAKRSNPRRRRRAAIGAAAVGAAAVAGATVYRNRENLVIKHVAVYRALKSHRKKARETGQKLESWDIQWIKEQERKDHAHRSVFRVREYREARRVAKLPTSRGRSLRPDRKVNAYTAGMSVTGVPNAKQNYYFESYRKDVYSRAVQRHGRMKGKKRRFGYDSGKRLTVLPGGKVKREFW